MVALSYKIAAPLEKKLKKISELFSEKKVQLKGYPPETLEAIHRYARISNIGASTRIENAILTDTEIDWLDTKLGDDSRIGSFEKQKSFIENKLSKDKERSIEEVAGLRRLLSIIYSQPLDLFPLKEIDLRNFHKELLCYYPPAQHYVGQYKTASNSVVERIGNKITRQVFQTADPGLITNMAMQELVAWYNKNLPEYLWPLAVITEFVYRFLAIHPFQDGNGRLGRSLFLLGMLHAHDENLRNVSPYLAVDRQVEKNRALYYIVLRQCSGGIFKQDPAKYKIEVFLNFMLNMIQKSLEEDIDYYAGKHSTWLLLEASPRKVLECFRDHPEVRLTSGEIAKLIQMNRRTVTRAVDILEERGFIQRFGKGAGTHYQEI